MFRPRSFLLARGLAAAVSLCVLPAAQAEDAPARKPDDSLMRKSDEAVIRKNLADRMTDLQKIDEITKTPVPGLYEVRVGTDLYYTDSQGNYLLDGTIFDTRSKANLTEARMKKITAIDFATLPLKDAVVWKQGTGARKIVIFADPNCGYCKRFERDLLNVRDVTVYTFLYPILGGDSPEKSRDIWCSKESGKTWRDWMIQGVTPVRSMGACDTDALKRVAEFGRKHRINTTPSIVFSDGTRTAGALPAEEVEKQLASIKP